MDPLPAPCAVLVLLYTEPKDLVANLLLYPGLNTVWSARRKDRPDEYEYEYVREQWRRRWGDREEIGFDATIYRKRFGLLHSVDDKPAVEVFRGATYWCRNDVLHRENDRPAVVCANGDKKWYRNGLLHRENDLPAVMYADGDREWYRDGLRHRDTDLPAVVYARIPLQTQQWFYNGEPYYPMRGKPRRSARLFQRKRKPVPRTYYVQIEWGTVD